MIRKPEKKAQKQHEEKKRNRRWETERKKENKLDIPNLVRVDPLTF